MHKARSLGVHPTAPVVSSAWVWMLISLMAHTGWGAYPVLARYLQTVSHIPSMALLATANIVALGFALPFIHRHLDLRQLRSPVLWGLALIVVVRAITNLLAARYTHAIYVQLITLMTPLLVALMSAGLFRDKLPPYTLPAIGFSLLGSLLMITGDLGAGELTLVMGMHDWIGIALACASTLCLASYMLLVPRIMRQSVPGETVLVVQLSALLGASIVISLVMGEDWGHFSSLGIGDWALFLVFALFVQLGANLGQIASLRNLGAPLVSSTMAWRLVSTLMIAALLLSERLTSLWQMLGAVIVLATITTYLWRQRSIA
ncbi:DMT family transporter [Candidatus Oscillochloris fontis]|uniref:DMT family transporter n=1 Tax=Candidatus Oscillochloris fontis TaxID=2496868 RepID=UPI001EE9AB74|nr:DMT family transporter [Candidatus Oscillochloris fontis]